MTQSVVPNWYLIWIASHATFCSCGASFVCSVFTVPAGVLKALSKTTEARPAVGQAGGVVNLEVLYLKKIISKKNLPFQVSGFSLVPHFFETTVFAISKMH